MSLHGTVSLASGATVDISIGEAPGDPVFTVPDLLPHLWGKSQATRKADEVLKGEELHLVVGSRPVDDAKTKERVKLAVLEHLNRAHGIVEEDLVSAEVERRAGGTRPRRRVRQVPRGRIRPGRQVVRVHVALQAILGLRKPARTCVAIVVDKEEIGSESKTSMKSRFFLNFLEDILVVQGATHPEHALWRSEP